MKKILSLTTLILSFLTNCISAQIEDSIILKESLRAYYTFDDKTANDKWIGGYDGVLEGLQNHGFAEDTPSGEGYSIRLDGDVWLIIPYNLIGGNTWSISFWIKGRIVQNIMREYSNKQLRHRIGINKEYTGMELSWGNTHNWLFSGTRFDEWTHIVIVHSGGKYQCYYNGNKLVEFQGGSTSIAATELMFGEDHTIISVGIPFGRVAYNLDNLRFYDIELTTDDIIQLYNARQ